MKFQYKAFKNNKIVKGKIEAETEKKVVDYLKSKDYIIVEISRDGMHVSTGGLFDRVSFTDIVNLTRQLAIMLNAGLTIIDSFDILKKQSTKPSLLKIIHDLSSEIKAGNSLSFALRKYPDHFNNLYISLIKAGEASGKLDEILLKLAENLEKQKEFQGKIKGALIYPVIVVIGMLGVMFVMITFVIPKLLNLYNDFNIELPATTKLLMAVSSFLQLFWPLVIGASIGGVILLKRYLKTKRGKLLMDTLVLKIPVVNKVVRISALVDTTRTLAVLIASGVSILEALNIIIETSSNVIYQKAFANVYTKIEKGQSLGQSLEDEGIFPPILVQMATVGEQTGHLDDTLLRLSNYFQMESELAIKAMTTLIEPAILVILGVGVGFLVMSVITPIYNLTNSFQ
ncbi:MAG TPA: type II secretion system F family protein [Candidatus Nitrosocosmicus sp.]|nr:type II secretion system F family protein [Candidatus Nitrosocosmicus sp.]